MRYRTREWWLHYKENSIITLHVCIGVVDGVVVGGGGAGLMGLDLLSRRNNTTLIKNALPQSFRQYPCSCTG